LKFYRALYQALTEATAALSIYERHAWARWFTAERYRGCGIATRRSGRSPELWSSTQT